MAVTSSLMVAPTKKSVTTPLITQNQAKASQAAKAPERPTGGMQGKEVPAATSTSSNPYAKPVYTNQYATQLADILNQIQNPEQFKYEFNGDEMFRQYADLYTQKGKQASLDAMGQAAALTGGYGNSYAQQVGNQAYQQYLLDLYDKGAGYRDAAYQQYQDEQQGLKDQYNILYNQEQSDYAKYRDMMSDWEANRKYAYNYCMNILNSGKMPTDELLQQAGISRADAESMRAQILAAAGGGGGGGRGGSGGGGGATAAVGKTGATMSGVVAGYNQALSAPKLNAAANAVGAASNIQYKPAAKKQQQVSKVVGSGGGARVTASTK